MPILPAVKAQGSLSPVVGLSVTSVKYTLPAPPSTVGRKRRGKDLTEVERAVKKAVREQRNREAASRSRRQRKDFQSYLENENANLLEEGCRLRKRLCTQEDVNKRLLEKIDILSQQVEGIRTLVQNAGATHGSPLSSLDRLTSISSPSDHENDTLSAPGLASSPDHASSPSVTFSPTSSPETHHLRYPVPDYTSFTDFPLFASPSTTSPTFTDDLDTLLTDILTSPSTTTDEASHPEPAAFESSLPRIQLASSPHQHSPTQKSTPSSSSPHQMQTMVFLAVAMMTARACRPEVWKVLVTAWYVCWWVVAGRVKVVLERHFRKGATVQLKSLQSWTRYGIGRRYLLCHRRLNPHTKDWGPWTHIRKLFALRYDGRKPQSTNGSSGNLRVLICRHCERQYARVHRSKLQ